MNLIDSQIRTLAKSSYWQQLYDASLKSSSISLFDNKDNYSGLQIRHLYWLKTYKMLYEELSTFEDDTLSEIRIENNFLCDCYLIHRNKKQEFLWKKYRQEEREAKLQAKQKHKFKNDGKRTTYEVKLEREPKNA